MEYLWYDTGSGTGAGIDTNTRKGASTCTGWREGGELTYIGDGDGDNLLV